MEENATKLTTEKNEIRKKMETIRELAKKYKKQWQENEEKIKNVQSAKP